MSPVDAHSENQPTCYYQPAVLPEAAAGTSSQVEPFQCQLFGSSTEQVPLPTVSLNNCLGYFSLTQKLMFFFLLTEPCATNSKESRTKGCCSREGRCCC